MGEGVIIGRHPVDRCDGAQGAGEVIGASVAHDTDGAHRQNCDEGLPDFIIQPVFADLVDVDRISLAQDLEFFAGDLAGAADRKAGAREGVAADEAGGQAQFTAKGAHFVFEQLAQRLDQFQAHFLGQTADVVVAFDRDRGAAGEADAFDHIGIKRALGEEFSAVDVVGVFLEDVDEKPADDFALGFRVGLAIKLAKEQFAFVCVDQRDVVVVAEHLDDFVGFIFAQQAVVNEDAGQLVADGFVDQDRGDGRIDAARQTADHLFVADLLADLSDGFFAVSAHGPVAAEACKPHEVFVELGALGCVVHLGVELHRIKVASGSAVMANGALGEVPKTSKPGAISATWSPWLIQTCSRSIVKPAVKQARLFSRRHVGAAEFGGAVAAFHLARRAFAS